MAMDRDQATADWIQRNVDSGRVAPVAGHPNNPDTHDLAGSNAEYTSSSPPMPYYVVDIDSTSSTATLQGVTFSDFGPYQGQLLLVMTTGAPTNTVTLEDANGSASDPFQLATNANESVASADDWYLFVYDGDGWQEVGRVGNTYEAAEILAGTGSLSDPSITFGDDPDTGLASPTADELAVVVGGSEICSISASSETNDGMTADPETGNENGFITVQIGASAYEIPLYDA